MAKKIQLSTVRQTADVEVLFVNAALICKVINANNALKSIIDSAKLNQRIKAETQLAKNDDGTPCLTEDGYEIEEPILDKNGKPVVHYSSYCLEAEELMELAEDVLPFLDELRTILEGE